MNAVLKMFAHDEDARWFRPRHPIVCCIDVLGFIAATFLIGTFKPSFIVAILPLTISLQYVVSFLHHFMRYSRVRSKLDRSVIFLVIAATYVPYWGSLLSQQDALLRLSAVALGTIFGLWLLLTEKSENVVNVFWAFFASAGLVVSFFELQRWLTQEGLVLFWTGTSLYGLQQLVYATKRPNLKPGVFGYRETQHLLLVCATTLGAIVVILYI